MIIATRKPDKVLFELFSAIGISNRYDKVDILVDKIINGYFGVPYSRFKISDNMKLAVDEIDETLGSDQEDPLDNLGYSAPFSYGGCSCLALFLTLKPKGNGVTEQVSIEISTGPIIRKNYVIKFKLRPWLQSGRLTYLLKALFKMRASLIDYESEFGEISHTEINLAVRGAVKNTTFVIMEESD